MVVAVGCVCGFVFSFCTSGNFKFCGIGAGDKLQKILLSSDGCVAGQKTSVN